MRAFPWPAAATRAERLRRPGVSPGVAAEEEKSALLYRTSSRPRFRNWSMATATSRMPPITMS